MDPLVSLIKLRLRLMLRPATSRGSWGVVMACVKVLLFVPASLLAAFGTHLVLTGTDVETATRMVHRLFLFVYASWILMPLFGMRAGSFAEPARLAVYPVHRAVLYTASTLGAVTSAAILFVTPMLIAAVLALPGSAAAMCGRVAMTLLFVLHGAVLMQIISTAFARILHSRRFHDLSAVLISLACVGVYMVVRSAFAADSTSAGFVTATLGAEMPLAARLLPTYWLTAASTSFGTGAMTLVELDLTIAFLAVTGALVAFAYRLYGKALRGELAASGPQARTRIADPVDGRHRRRLPAVFDPVVAAFLRKELRLLSREPLVKAQLIVQIGFLLLPMLLGLSMTARGKDAVPDYMPELLFTAISFAIVVVESSIVFNMFGLEGRGFAHLLATPLSRRSVLLWKNAFSFLLFGSGNAAVLALFAIAMHFAYGTPAAVLFGLYIKFLLLNWSLLALAISVGNLTSVAFPVRLSTMGCNVGIEASGSESFSRLLLRGLATGMILLAMAPLAILVSLPKVQALGPWFQMISVIVAGLCIAAAYGASLAIGERLLRRKEPQLLQYFCYTT